MYTSIIPENLYLGIIIVVDSYKSRSTLQHYRQYSVSRFHSPHIVVWNVLKVKIRPHLIILLSVHKIYWLTEIIAFALENQQYCTGLLLIDIASAFYEVWNSTRMGVGGSLRGSRPTPQRMTSFEKIYFYDLICPSSVSVISVKLLLAHALLKIILCALLGQWSPLLCYSIKSYDHSSYIWYKVLNLGACQTQEH